MYRKFAAIRCGRPILHSFPHLVIMKTFLLLTVAFTQLAAATGHAQDVTIKVSNTPISQVLYQLSQQSGYDFIYDANVLKSVPAVTVELDSAPLKSALEACFAGQSLEFVFNDDKTVRSEAHTSELQSLMRISYAVFCLQ